MAVVETQNEVSLNGVRYPITAPVQSILASIYPAKVVIGDTTRDSQQRASVVAWSDWRGGVGIERMEGAVDVDRAWWSTCQLRYKQHLVLPHLATQTAASGKSGVFDIGIIGEYNSVIYASYGFDVYSYSNVADSWTDTSHDLGAAATDALNFNIAGTEYLAIAYTTGYSYYNGSSWATDTTYATKYMSFWDDRLWGISAAGQLWYALAPGTEVSDALIPLGSDSVTDLFVGRNAQGEPNLFAMTTEGLWAHDSANAKWIATELELPRHPDNGRGTTRWRDAVYIPSGLGIYKYTNGANSAVVSIVGPDRDHGIPSNKRGTVRQLMGTHNELLALVDATASQTISSIFDGGAMGSHHGGGELNPTSVVSPDVGFSHIMGWNETGWEVKWLSGSSVKAVNYAHVSNAYDKYRLWWAIDERVYHLTLPKDIINPSEISDFDYAASGTHETPWFSADQVDIDKLALELRVETASCTSTETVEVYYRLDYSDSTTYQTTQMETAITSNGVTTYKFPNNTTPTGTSFRSIKFVLDLVRGSTTTNSPDVISTTFIFRKKLPAKWGHSVEVDLNNDYAGNNAMQLRSNLVSAIESTSLVEFTFRSDSGGTRNYYVDVVSATGMEFTGMDERGTSRITVVEP